MGDGLFSTYRGGENRVTASILAVLQGLTVRRMERLLAALLDNVDFRLVTIRNQTALKGAASVPDGEISASCRILVETKTERNAVRLDQLQGHLTRLDTVREREAMLLVLTPDHSIPTAIEQLKDQRAAWASFAMLDQAIDELLFDKLEVISEREAYLLRELQHMMIAEDLLTIARDTVIVAAKLAWPEYQQFSAYVCQPDRAFQAALYVGFYSHGQIQPYVAKVLSVHNNVVFETGRHNGDLGATVDAFLLRGLRVAGAEHKVFLLSPPSDDATIRLAAPVRNNLQTASGRPLAFTQGQRYVPAAALRVATRTSDLMDRVMSA